MSTVVDETAYRHSVKRFREEGIALPTFAQLADPSLIPPAVEASLAGVDRNGRDPRNLFRVHWYNRGAGPGRVEVPEHLVLPPSLTGVPAPIVALLGNRFPMVRAHKVLAAYACLAPRIVTGQFDPSSQRAVWPSTGNYARGGVAISRIMGCRGIAVLPENMSRARFDWLDSWVADPADIIRTPGSESNVKEIYDALRRAGGRSRQRHLQPVLRVPQPPGPLPGDRPGAGPGVRPPPLVLAVAGAGAAGVRGRVGVGRHARRRGLPEGAVRIAHRRRRGARMPDHALQRVRRAQHPGHRRQAHPADPQRDQQRRRRRRLGPLDRCARRAVQRWERGGLAGLAGRGRALDRRPARGPRTVEHLQRTGGHQAGQTTRPRSRRRGAHRGDRQRRPVRRRAGVAAWRAIRLLCSPSTWAGWSTTICWS